MTLGPIIQYMIITCKAKKPHRYGMLLSKKRKKKLKKSQRIVSGDFYNYQPPHGAMVVWEKMMKMLKTFVKEVCRRLSPAKNIEYE